MKTRPYIILAPTYCVSAGVRVLHTLCHELNSLGFDAKLLLTQNISPDPMQILNPALKTPCINGYFAEQWEAINEESIIICSDGIPAGAPLGAKRVVRYVLGKEGDTPPSDEFMLFFSKTFPRDQSGTARTLFHLPVDLSLFNANRAPQRDQDLIWLGKGAKYCTEMPPYAKLMSYEWPATRQELADNLRRTRYLYSYDAVSCTNVEAVLCGAVVILKHISYNDQLWTRANMEATELGVGGYAFGDSDLEIERARRSGAELIALARHHVAAYPQRLLEFVDQSQSYFRD